MPPKAKIQQPIDRPLSRAYVRQFKGWATADPPGLSDPASFRLMENIMVERDGGASIRPGARYLSYSETPFSKDASALTSGMNRLVYRGFTALTDQTRTTVPLPAGSQVGDLVVVTAQGARAGGPDFPLPAGAVSDGRLTGKIDRPCGSDHWGTLTSLDPLSIELSGQNSVLISVFGDSEGLTPLTVTEGWKSTTHTTDLGNATEDHVIDSYPANGVITIVTENTGFSSQPALTPGFTYGGAIESSQGRIDYWTGEGPSPLAIRSTDSSYQRYDLTVTTLPIGIEVVSAADREFFGLGAIEKFVGTQESFYLDDGSKAYLQAVRELDDTVGFRVMVIDVNDSTIYGLQDPLLKFDVPQTEAVLNFTADTTHVSYLQIDNKIFALSDNGENMRLFTVGKDRTAKALAAITRPEFTPEDKLTVVHPDASWISGTTNWALRRNLIDNPSFETNSDFFDTAPRVGFLTQFNRDATPASAIVQGKYSLRMISRPTRENLATSPLHNVASTGIAGWTPHNNNTTLSAPDDYLKIAADGQGDFYAKSRVLHEAKSLRQYHVAFDKDEGGNVNAKVMVIFLGSTGSRVGEVAYRELGPGTKRVVTTPIRAPKGTISMKVLIGGTAGNGTGWVKAKNLVVCEDYEPTEFFWGGKPLDDYSWAGDVNDSISVYHPPVQVQFRSDRMSITGGQALSFSLYCQAASNPRNGVMSLILLDKDRKIIETIVGTPTPDTTGTPTRFDIGTAAAPANATQAIVRLTFNAVPRGEAHHVDGVMLEPFVSTPGSYFDGSTGDSATIKHKWVGKRHASHSQRREYLGAAASIPLPETPTSETLISSIAADNVYRFGFFYTFSNEVGESAASDITITRAQRSWGTWRWETPDSAGAPSGTFTNDAAKCADQLVAYMPESVYDEALAQGAIEWSLYMFTWSDQDASPVTAIRIGHKDMPLDGEYQSDGWIAMTPGSPSGDLAAVPSAENRYNYSDPSRGGQGLVAGDRMVMVNDPTAAGVIKYSSNRQGEYTNFTASKGGGYKTLTSGNLFVPAAVKLWQNPQSADTITILCLGTDGYSTSYYMAPAVIAAQSEQTNIMSFEETTATQGTTSPWGVEVFNNALYHPLDDQLVKSTASNYNINHKSQTDMIRNMWEKLQDKYWIMSGMHDMRLYYVVNNPEGEPLEAGCKGNEIWVFDAASEAGTWSRLLIQAHSLRTIEFGGRIYMSFTRPDGIYFLDPEYGLDDYVREYGLIAQKAIPWVLETNTQGANRAHDAWAHLQMAAMTLGNFQGRMEWGVRSTDINGKGVDFEKVTKHVAAPYDNKAYDIEDMLLIRRDLKEWYFRASSTLDDAGAVEPSFGQISLVQYRYTPSTVNTGYEYGSVETFQYGRDVAQLGSTSDNGVPTPLQDNRRP